MITAQKWFRILCCAGLVIVFGVIGTVGAEEDQGCEHNLVRARTVVLSKEFVMEYDEAVHMNIRHTADMICKYCGEYGDELHESGYTQPHSYKLVDWFGADENITMLLRCHLCGFQKSFGITYEAILNDRQPPCLTGEKCGRVKSGHLTTNGEIVPWLGTGEEDANLIAVIYDEEAHTYQPRTRHYCAVCGRPGYDGVVRPESTINENWDELPIMTEEYFLTVDMPDNLPYQLIDQIRKENGVA